MSCTPPLSLILLSLSDPEALVNDVAQTLETHMAAKGGLTGTAMKLGFNALRAAKPDIAARAARNLLPDIAKALDPIYAEFKAGNGADFGQHLGQHASRASSVVLAAVDVRMAQINNSAATAIYKRFKSSADGELQKLLPVLGGILAKHIH